MDAAAQEELLNKLSKMLEGPIKKIGNAVYNKCEKEVKKYLNTKKQSKDDWLREYIIESYKEIGRTKNLLYGTEDKLIEDFCICTDLEYKDNNGETIIIKTDKIDNILRHSRKTIITGSGGMGKTIMMRYMFIHCIKQTEYIPVFIELRDVPDDNGKISIFNEIKKSLTRYGLEMDDELLKISLENGRYLILFDGFDEVTSELLAAMAEEIIDFSVKYAMNHYVVSSRSDIFISWSGFKELNNSNLNIDTAVELLEKLDYCNDKKAEFIGSLKKELFEKYKTFAQKPLLLTIMLIVYCDNRSLSDNFCDFYEEAFNVLYTRHDLTKKHEFQHEIKSQLSKEELKKLFINFCYISFCREKYSFTDSELKDLIEKSAKKMGKTVSAENVQKDFITKMCMIKKDGLKYRFEHRNFQSYFAAIYTTKKDDADQKKIINKFLKSNQVKYSEYLPILHHLEPERLYKNVVSERLDELEEIYNSVNHNDYEFILEIFKGCSVKITEDVRGISNIEYHNKNFIILQFLMWLFNSDLNMREDYSYMLIMDHLAHFIFRNSEIIRKILKKYDYDKEIDDLFDDVIYNINFADIIQKICTELGSTESVIKHFKPLIDYIKSWFTNRLYQESVDTDCDDIEDL